MRVAVAATPNQSGWEILIRFGDQQMRHEMLRMALPLPIAPKVVGANGAERTHGVLDSDPQAREEISSRIAGCSPRPGDVEIMGRYLFDALIGCDVWTAIGEAAKADAARLIELALTWDGADVDLNLPKWELMHDGEEFLAACRSRAVAITRIVRDAPPPDHPLDQLAAPARVLFVVGSDLADPDIRAGAEIMGLLRRVEQGQGAITPYVLEDASIRKLRREAQRFRPDVVHFVTHGRVLNGHAELLLRDDDDDGRGAYASAEQLLDVFRDSEGLQLPSLAVVTACESAATHGHTVSLATQLVRGGIPVVVGMTGVVSDPVCRLFSNRFGAALTESEPLVQALTDGRRAALLYGSRSQGEQPGDRVDWALPALFLAPSVPPDHILVDVEGTVAVHSRINAFGLQQKPVFCGRREFMRLLDRLLDPLDQLNVLFTSVERPNDGLVGETRLLHELAHRALRSGHVVVMISAGSAGTRSTPPTTPGQLASLLLRELFETRRRFSLKLPGDPAILEALMNAVDGESDLRDKPEDRRLMRLNEYLDNWEGELSASVLHEALAFDLARLASDARASDDPSIADDCRVIVLLEGIAGWGETTRTLADTLLTPSGLGFHGEPIPVVLTYTHNEVHRETLKELQDHAHSDAWIHFEPLRRFEEPEDTLAYQWMLLNPYPGIYSPHSEKVYVRSKLDVDWQTMFQTHVSGLPDRFGKVFYTVASILAHAQILVDDDDDEAKLAAYVEGHQ